MKKLRSIDDAVKITSYNKENVCQIFLKKSRVGGLDFRQC